MLHAFDDSDGTELWGFVPPNLFTKLQALHADVVEYFVDGSPKAHIASNSDGSISQAILIFGERRGGNRFYALDVTDPVNPRYLWEIGPSTLGFEELGDSWSTPNIGKIAYGTGEKWVVFIGGGYDENQDNDPITEADSKGRAIYIVDALTGALLWRYSHQESSLMAYSIPSDIARLDSDGDGRIDRLYVGDMGGRIWRFDIKSSDNSAWAGRIIFQSNEASGDKRKVFYPPDVTLENDGRYYEMLFFGTGDREHPKDSTVINRLYAMKDRDVPSVLSENDLVNVTEDILQDPDASETEKKAVAGQLKTGNGWFIKLDSNPGEKSLSPAVVFNKVVYFTTFAPTTKDTSGDPCYVGEGTARIYMLRYNTGNAVFNLDLGNDIGGVVVSKEDRSTTIGTAIPSGVIVTFIQGTAVAYTGVGGGVSRPILSNTRELIPVDWQIVF
jgi:type IV pilus assembly protein PilY1